MVPGGGSTSAPVDLSNTGGATGGTGGAAICNELTIVPTPVVPTVLLLVDNSSSMFEKDQNKAGAIAPWDLLYSTLMADTGIVKSLQDKVRFGFTSYKGNPAAQMNETDPACADLKSVSYALNNFDAINTTYKALGTEWMPGTKWETPTGHAFARAATDLAALTTDPPGPKNIILVTDGNPNTCQIVDPQCGQDLSIKAVQDAFAAGIRTYTIGIGEVITGNVGCEPAWGRCGPDHLQDLANAGLGMPVMQPPEQFVWQNCADRYGRVLQGTYATAGGPERAHDRDQRPPEQRALVHGGDERARHGQRRPRDRPGQRQRRRLHGPERLAARSRHLQRHPERHRLRELQGDGQPAHRLPLRSRRPPDRRAPLRV
jgi:hypothetical protein